MKERFNELSATITSIRGKINRLEEEIYGLKQEEKAFILAEMNQRENFKQENIVMVDENSVNKEKSAIKFKLMEKITEINSLREDLRKAKTELNNLESNYDKEAVGILKRRTAEIRTTDRRREKSYGKALELAEDIRCLENKKPRDYLRVSKLADYLESKYPSLEKSSQDTVYAIAKELIKNNGSIRDQVLRKKITKRRNCICTI